jgi:programmed cell death protein 5
MAESNINPGDLPDGFSTRGPQAQPDGAQNKQMQDEQKAMILEQACTPEALARLGRIKLVKPEKVEAVENSIVAMATQGKLPARINEGKMIEILERGSMKKAGEAEKAQRISIQRKRYALDSDDEDDNDDDLL